MTTLPIDLDWENMVFLLDKFRRRILTRQEAAELEPLLKIYYNKALLKGDAVLANKLAVILIGLIGYISGEISESDYKRLTNVR